MFMFGGEAVDHEALTTRIKAPIRLTFVTICNVYTHTEHPSMPLLLGFLVIVDHKGF